MSAVLAFVPFLVAVGGRRLSRARHSLVCPLTSEPLETDLLRDQAALADISPQSSPPATRSRAHHRTAATRNAATTGRHRHHQLAETRSQVARLTNDQDTRRPRQFEDYRPGLDAEQLAQGRRRRRLGSRQTRRGVSVEQLPALLESDYQLWVVDPQYPNPVDGGVFAVDAQTGGRCRSRPASRWAVSLRGHAERKEACPRPRGLCATREVAGIQHCEMPLVAGPCAAKIMSAA